jgi:hypothetical protein
MSSSLDFRPGPFRSRRAGVELVPAVLVAGLSLSGCLEGATVPDPVGIGGQWCTEGTIGPGEAPLVELPYIAMVLGQEGTRVEGSGAVKRTGSSEIWSVRVQGTAVGTEVTLNLDSFLSGEDDPPSFVLNLTQESASSMVGEAVGDPGFPGILTLVREFARCTAG